MHIPFPKTAAGLSLAAASALLVMGCGGTSSPSVGNTGSQGSGTVATAPAAHTTTKPAAPGTTAPAAQTGISISKDIVIGHTSACKVVDQALVAAIIGPITSVRNAQTNQDCELNSAKFTASVDFATPHYWPTMVTDTFSNPVDPRVGPNPCPHDTSRVYGESSSQYNTAAFCSNGSYGIQVSIAPLDNVSNNGPAQIRGVSSITAAILAAYAS